MRFALATISLIAFSGISCDEQQDPTSTHENAPPPRTTSNTKQGSNPSPESPAEGEALVRKLREPLPGSRPEPPVAVAVPGKPGFVFSPYNNKIVDVTGMPEGTLIADPNYSAEEKKHFRLPKTESPEP